MPPIVGIFLRKSFGAGPLRFNISKSGISMSAGVRGLRVGIGPRGASISGGRKGVYFRKSLSSGSRSSSSSSTSSANIVRTISHQQSVTPRQKLDASQFSKAEKPMNAGGYALAITFALLGILPLLTSLTASGVEDRSSPLYVAVTWFGLAGLAYWRKSAKIKRYMVHESNLVRLKPRADEQLLMELRASVAVLKKPAWAFRHRYIYAQLFDQALEDGIDDEEMAWLNQVSDILGVKAYLIHEAKIKERMWGSMADSSVTEAEEGAIKALLQVCGVPEDALKPEMYALQQFIAARPVQEGNLPTVETDINLQRGEVCHHQTSGSILEKRVLRTYTVNRERYKEEGLTVSKSGQIFITSKRILIVGDGTSSIPHSKILETEIDPDNQVISITKDGRQKPLFLRVPDLIYTGILLEAVSTTP
jgi:hypothetical protein